MTAHVSESIVINAPADRIYDLVADVNRMGEWSPEATGARGASDSPQVGDKFVGLNKRGPIRWFTVNTVLAADRGAEFEFDTDFGPLPVSRWRYDFEPVDEGRTRVVETWQDRRTGLRAIPIKAIGQVIIPGNRENHNRANMITTLRQLKRAAEKVDA